jgi:hypothetical protein
MPSCLAGGARDRLALRRARPAERLCRKLQRPSARRVSQRAPVRQSHGARQIIEEWRIDYNTNRPHTSLNGLTPTEFATRPNRGPNLKRESFVRRPRKVGTTAPIWKGEDDDMLRGMERLGASATRIAAALNRDIDTVRARPFPGVSVAQRFG